MSEAAVPGEAAAGPSAEVAIALPVRGTFHYSVPPGLADLVAPGSVLAVPFGRRFETGYVVAVGTPPPAGVELKPIREVLLPGDAVTPDLLALAGFVADYYLATVGEVLRAALPSASVRSRLLARVTAAGRAALGGPEPPLRDADRALLALLAGSGPMAAAAAGRAARVRSAPARLRRLEAEGLVVLEASLEAAARPARRRLLAIPDDAPPPGSEARARCLHRSAKTAALLALVERGPGPVPWPAARREIGALPAHLDRLVKAGLVRVTEVEIDRDLAAAGGASRRLAALELTPAQRAAADAVGGALDGGFTPFLLHGVTGSGKTLVYLEAVAAALARGRSAILLVPEIGLTPVLGRELRGRFGAEVAVLHSGLSQGERYDAWRRVRAGQSRVVFGARSAVFAPARDLGLIIVDEEHDSSYKQDDRPHYHARDVAVARAKLLGIPIVLGSATPALESYDNARRGRYRLLEIQERTAGQVLPAVEVVDLRQEFERSGGRVLLSAKLEAEIEKRLAAGEQSMLLLNRRGYANFLLCRECGVRLECPNCSVCLAFHLREARVKCHRCGHERPQPRACAACRGTFLQLVGYGTEKVETALAERFPGARIARLDRDTTRARGELGRLLGRFERREVDLLVGTQMVAKGHDFPNVTLVGVVSVDALLALPDFRATERTFALLTQVAGRAGRGARPGQVVLQTYYPDNEAVKLACAQDYRHFFEREMRLRRLMRYPPASFLVNLIVRGRDRDKVEADAREVAAVLLGARPAGVDVLGPALAPVERLKGDYRSQILVRGGERKAVRATLERAHEALSARLERGSLDLDVDPQDLL